MVYSRSAILALHASAHDCLHRTLTHAATMPTDLFTVEVPGFGRSRLHEQFAHVLTTELAWVRGLQLLPLQRVDPALLRTVDDTLLEQKRVAADTVTYLNSLDDIRFNTELDQLP